MNTPVPDKYSAAWQPPPPPPPPLPAVAVRVLSAPKEGNSPEQYEDAWAHSPLNTNAPLVTVAVADGASSAVFARQWANLLVLKGAGDGLPASDAEAAQMVMQLGQTWRKSVESKATSWHAQEKLSSGSHAALLVVQFDRENQTWTAAGRGDVCVFLVRENRLRFAFPLTKSAHFDDRPDLVGTEPVPAKNGPPEWKRMEAAWEMGDRFLFATDALAAWFLGEWEQKHLPWDRLPADKAAFEKWLKQKRDDGEIKNDDVTLLEAKIG